MWEWVVRRQRWMCGSTSAGWQPIGVGIDANIGANGMAAETHDGNMATPMGVFTLDFAFGTKPNPGGGLQYVQVGPDHWWDGDMKSPTYNTMQVCKKAQCPFATGAGSGTENLEIPQYAHAVVMGVNKPACRATAAHSSCTPPTAARPRAVWRSTTPRW